MSNEVAIQDQAQPPAKRDGFGSMLKAREAQFVAALPKHIPVERFMRVVMTAIQNDPKLRSADQASLFTSCVKAAQDGLLPDGRDGALVIYLSKVNGQWVDKVQWMPMIGGIRKKARNSGELSDWNAVTVFAKDEFDYEEGTNRFLRHKPFIGRPLPKANGESADAYTARMREHCDRGSAIAFYSIATFKSGGNSFDVMTASEVEYVRDNYSKKNRDGNFSPAWTKSFNEMAKKTVARRHSKTLPMSSDLDDLLRRDDDLYDLKGASDKSETALPQPRRSLGERLDMLSGSIDEAPDPLIEHDPETGEIASGADPGQNTDAGAKPGAAATDHPVAKASGDSNAATASQSAPATGDRAPAAAKATAKTKTRQAAGASAPAPVVAAADPAKHAAIKADLTREGERAAAQGTSALNEFLDGLTGDESALIGDKFPVWNKTARAADTGVAR